jgi:hypothetical protein
MPRKPIELPPAIAQASVKDMRALFAEENAIMRAQEIKGSREKKLRLSDVHEMFLEMREHLGGVRLGEP